MDLTPSREETHRRGLEVLALIARFRDGRLTEGLREAATHAAGMRLGTYALEEEPHNAAVIAELLDAARMFLDREGWSMDVVNTWCDHVAGRARTVRYPIRPPQQRLRVVPDA